jgi:tRNA U34 5-methylaminomethyl-2-thiouridine-forming methyltransferase MnmC
VTYKFPDIDWINNSVPVSRKFNDSYYSRDDGVAEANYVFLQGNNLPERFYDGFQIGELGFGIGLNMLVSLQSFLKSKKKGCLHYTSFEKYPLSKDQLKKALTNFPSLDTKMLMDHWSNKTFTINYNNFFLTVIIGDARHTLKNWKGKADAWFLDGFSPSKNPQLWGPKLLGDLAKRTEKNGSFSTYSAAGYVRENLMGSGFKVQKVPGYGRKRHMLKGTLT